jgi:hypothetical protein
MEIIFLLLIVFVPTLVAHYRHAKRERTCFLINILLGWTILVWVPLLAWSLFTDSVKT